MAKQTQGKQVNAKELGEIFGVTAQTIRRWVAEGMPITYEGKGGRAHVYDSAACTNWRIFTAAGDRQKSEPRQLGPQSTLEQVRIANTEADTRLKEVRLAQLRGEVAPIEVIEHALSKTSEQICAIFETIPLKIRRRNPKLTATDLEIAKRELTKALNIAASVMPELDEPSADR